MSKQFYFKQFSLAWICSLNVKTVLFDTIQFSTSTQFTFIWPLDRALSGAATPSVSEAEIDGNEGLPRTPQSSSITGASLSDCFVS